MKDETLEIIFTRGVEKCGIHEHGFIVRAVALLLGHVDLIVQFLPLQNRMEIVE